MINNRTNAPITIAEIGCNHKGDMAIAQEMIKAAATVCKVDVVKFQKRTPFELLSSKEFKAPHPNPMHSYGKNYGEHREYLEFDKNQHQTMKKWCEKEGVVYSTSIWDLTAAKQIIPLNPQLLKIPSASNLDFNMLDYICDHYTGEIHLSLGMTTHLEEEKIVQFFENKNKQRQLVIYACTSAYPVPFEDICLLEIKRLKERYGKRVKGIGFSGHHLGTAVDIAALTLGARWIERHFTLDRTWKGTDHAASLEPDGMRKLVQDIKNTNRALNYKSCEILDIENAQRKKLKRMI